MALTVTPLYKWPVEHTGSFLVVIKVTGDTSFPSGGYSITPSLFTLNAFADTSDSQLQVAPAVGAVYNWGDVSGGGRAQFDATTGNLTFYVSTTGVIVGTGSTAAGYSTILAAFGR